jgi:hypothetical protein
VPTLLTPPKGSGYKDVYEVGQAVLDEMKALGADYGVSTYAQYQLQLNDGTILNGRFISIRDGVFYFASEQEYTIRSVKAGIQTFRRRADRLPSAASDQDQEEQTLPESNISFGKFNR